MKIGPANLSKYSVQLYEESQRGSPEGVKIEEKKQIIEAASSSGAI